MNYSVIEEKHKRLIDIAKDYMNQIEDSEHDMAHVRDVVEYTKILLEKLNACDETIDSEICIIGAYWHDVGRIEKEDGHEELSSIMLVDTMKKLGYDDDFIYKCSEAIKYHGYNMFPKTREGLVLQDVEKIAWLGSRRWRNCLDKRRKLNTIIDKMPRLRNETLHFECSRRLYDREIVKIVVMFYYEIYGNNIMERLREDDISLEPANMNDFDKIVELYSERSNWFEDNGISQWQNYLENHPREEFITAIKNSNFYLLKKDNEIVAGFELSDKNSFWEDDKNAYYIYKVVTKVGYRDLGKYIFGLCECFARRDGKKYLRLECKSDNKKLNDMYEEYGFEFIGTIQSYCELALREKELI